MTIQEALDEYLVLISDAMVNELFNNKSVATGDLARSIKNDNKVVKTDYGYDAILTMLWYGETVDEGTGRGPGGMPPLKPIQDWIRRKGITIPPSFKTPKAFAFAIQRKIGKEGDRASKRRYPFINNSIEMVKRTYGDTLIEKAAGSQIEASLTLAFEKSTK